MITSVDAPVAGTTYPYDRNVQFAGLFQQNWLNNGPDQTWSFLPSPFDTSATWRVIAPQDTVFGSAFPGATVAHVVPFRPVIFDSLTAATCYRLGEVDEADSVRVYTDPALTLVYPCAIGASWSDAFTWVEPLSGAIGFGTWHDTADGYGTLELPWGSTGGVLALQETVTTWVVLNGDTTKYITRNRRWLKPGYTVDVAATWETRSYAPGDDIGIPVLGGTGAGYLGLGAFTGIAASDEQPLMGSLVSQEELRVTDPNLRVDHCTIVDAMGRVVLDRPWLGEPLSIRHIPNGHYHVRLSRAGEVVGAWPVVKW